MTLILFTSPVLAQTGDETALYQVSDISADVTADNATQARDQAIMQAQHSAFQQLLTRLGADSALDQKVNDDALASLVQAFEVQQERVLAKRYIGTFTMRFKPQAVRAFLGNRGTNFSEARSKPVLVLPIVNEGARAILWEERGPWRTAWENVMGKDGLVPIVVPSGEMEDIATISAAEAISGKLESLLTLMNKYQAESVVVAVLNANPDKLDPKQNLRLDIQRYDSQGNNANPEFLTLPPASDAKTLTASIADGVKQVRNHLESSWRQTGKTQTSQGPLANLPIAVPIATLGDWNEIKQKLAGVPGIKRANVVSLTRGNADIDLEFYGDIPQLQTILAQHDLVLEQSQANGGWILINNDQGNAL